ncbi:unnamed protein product, partial [Iphiclides podalirius]
MKNSLQFLRFSNDRMAGNRINTKAKGKEDKSKSNKGANQTNEETEDLDYTLLRKPVLTSVTGFAQARKIFDFATEELKSLLSTEYETEDRIPLTKDLTAIVEKFALNKGNHDSFNEEHELYLQKIPKTSVAMFQNVHFNKDTQCDILSQVRELDTILSQNKAVLQSDGKFTIQNSIGTKKSNAEHENVIQISDDDDNESNNILKCKICDLQFSTQKTLKFHMKYKHLESRLVYPCPDCLEIFSTSWSVYRHLFKVHRKTAAQIRRLRESIQAKAFRMNNPPAFYEKRKNNVKAATPVKITEEERLDQENQAWMDNMEGDGEIPRCGGCGRTFERRAALAAHTHTCQPRSRALARRADTKKIEIQIRKDYNKGPPAVPMPVKTTDANDNKLQNDEVQLTPKASLKDSPKEDEVSSEASNNIKEENIGSEKISTEKKIPYHVENFTPRLPFAQQVEKSNLAALKNRLQPDTDLDKLLCKKCDMKHSKLQDLYAHMANHYKWMRTVKAVDANEALELCEPMEEISDTNETSPDSRRPSRCSSDSSRLSDDSSSSSTRVEVGAKRRKMNNSRNITKKRKELVTNDEHLDKKCNDVTVDKQISENESPSNAKIFEENSSDIDEVDDKIAKKKIPKENKSNVSRRPVRKRTRPKNEDFEYDLSNLLKMEAQERVEKEEGDNSRSNEYTCEENDPLTINNESCNIAEGTMSEFVPINSESASSEKVYINETDSPVVTAT